MREDDGDFADAFKVKLRWDFAIALTLKERRLRVRERRQHAGRDRRRDVARPRPGAEDGAGGCLSTRWRRGWV